jgi:hypothetical protein
LKKLKYKAVITILVIALMIPFTVSCADKNEPDLNDLSAPKTTSEVTEPDRYKTVTAAPEPETEKETEPPETKPVVTTVTAAETQKQTPPEEGTQTGQTTSPVITGTINVNPNLICISGTCEADAKIYIRGGIAEVSYVSDDIYFIGTVEIPASGSTKLDVVARVKGKSESQAVTVTGTYKASATQIRNDAFEVVVGNNYQCHFVSALPDYLGTNLLTDEQKDKVKSNVENNVSWLKSNMNGAELIYLVIPNPMTVYPESVPAKYNQFAGEGRTEQFCKAAEAGGAVVINLKDTFIAHKNDDYKLFHKTDSHWTQYGAWLAYTELMNHISEKYPKAVPHTKEEMGFYTKDVNGGDMPYYLALDNTKVREKAVFANPTFKCPVNLQFFVSENDLLMNHETTPKAAVYSTGDSNLPNIYVMRDSFGIAVYNILPERFNKTTYKDMWSYVFDQKDIKASGANYVLYLVAERNIGELIY